MRQFLHRLWRRGSPCRDLMNQDETRAEREHAIWNTALPWVEELIGRLDNISRPGARMSVCTVVTETARDDYQGPAGAILLSGPEGQAGAQMVREILVPLMRVIQAETGMSCEEMLYRAAHEFQNCQYDDPMRRRAEWDC